MPEPRWSPWRAYLREDHAEIRPCPLCLSKKMGIRQRDMLGEPFHGRQYYIHCNNIWECQFKVRGRTDQTLSNAIKYWNASCEKVLAQRRANCRILKRTKKKRGV